jgi:hypothetical protein
MLLLFIYYVLVKLIFSLLFFYHTYNLTIQLTKLHLEISEVKEEEEVAVEEVVVVDDDDTVVVVAVAVVAEKEEEMPFDLKIVDFGITYLKCMVNKIKY